VSGLALTVDGSRPPSYFSGEKEKENGRFRSRENGSVMRWALSSAKGIGLSAVREIRW
jgi:hypothetical protein